MTKNQHITVLVLLSESQGIQQQHVYLDVTLYGI